MKIHTSEWLAPMSEKEMIEKFWVDVERRDPRTLKHNTRSTTVKRSDWEIAQVPNYQTTLNFDRKYPEFFENLEDYINKFVKEKPPVWDKKEWKDIFSGILATTMYADVHIDKRGGDSIDKIKKSIIEANKVLNGKLEKFEPEKQLLVVLGDFFNSDWNYKTTKGTEQQNSLSEYDWRKAGIELLAEVIYNNSIYSHLDVIITQGNHDENKALYMRDLLHYYFLNDEKVTIKKSNENGRNYYSRGENLLWFTHWHLIKPQDLPMVMNKENWNAKHKERYTGHRHKDITQSFHWMNIHTIGATSSNGERNDKFGVDHINKQLFGVLHHSQDGKIGQFYQKI